MENYDSPKPHGIAKKKKKTHQKNRKSELEKGRYLKVDTRYGVEDPLCLRKKSFTWSHSLREILVSSQNFPRP